MTEEKMIDRSIDSFIAESLSQKNGKSLRVAVLNRHFPMSIATGFGMIPIRPTLGTTTSAEAVGERLIRPDACPFCKTMMGNALTKKSAWANVDCAIASITCDQIRRSIDRLQEDCGVPVFSVSLPALLSDAGRQWFRQSVREVMDGLQKRTGNLFDRVAAISDYKLRAESASKLRKLILTCKYDPVILHKLVHAWMICEPSSFNKFLDDVSTSIPQKQFDKTIILIGGFVGYEDTAVIKKLSDMSIYPLPLNSTGLDPLEYWPEISNFNNDDSAIDFLCDSIFDAPVHVRTRPNGVMYERLFKAIKETKASGVVLKALTFCDLWYTEKVRMGELIDVPLLVISSGYGEGADAGLETRLETFAEQIG